MVAQCIRAIKKFARSQMLIVSSSAAVNLQTLTNLLYCRYIILPLILVLRIVDAVTCPLESSSQIGSASSSSSASKSLTLTKRKICPDFKDNEDEKYCCPSHVVPGSYYCCSQEHLYKIEAEKAAEVRRQFIKKTSL
ncbi:unnamed protein product [Gongylonema pulchrum]|uniref:Uncharacterized protein n=1 Tax=Gongylonema pulchrum TaxID=637853 RepID=A0A3P6TBS6_9BILA|nr:unnamed protein product [Gongylonema pulchrum]